MPSQFLSRDLQSAFPPVYMLNMVSYGMEYPLGLLGSIVLAMSPPNSLYTSNILTGGSYLKGGCANMGVGLFSQTASGRTRENGLKLYQGRLWLDISENFFIKRAVKKWYSVPREVVDSPLLDVDVALHNMI
ncbi:hypothetical protein WISP_146973 [Willisornis vidua]|uniref:Uncharacterized protein n=1 Tax=Willisornis vidua TaxID=1566151 RepID=A0ABQ9CQB8_9PASS|nr:hypothetical protein WISP_146973 [Willisornis vidua]